MKKYDPDRMELSARDVVSRAIATGIATGRGTPRGGVYLDVTHLPKEQIENRLPVMLEQFLKYGVDIRTEPMEVAPTAHHIMGGLKITPEGKTTLPGLFACGRIRRWRAGGEPSWRKRSCRYTGLRETCRGICSPGRRKG